MARRDLALHIAELIGAETVSVVDPGNGWPMLMEVTATRHVVPVAAHVSNVSPHSRQPYEWRFQNPATRDPVTAPDGSTPLLIGLDAIDGVEVLVVTSGESRLGREARFSILFDKRICREAAAEGWSEYVSSSGEHIYALRPRLFPLVVDLVAERLSVPTSQITNAALASGLIAEEDAVSGERARRMVSTYVRSAMFSKRVRAVYQNRCALCGVGLGLVAGAHIYPVSAPDSPDAVWNGIAMCHNHHSAFDAHKIWINSDFTIRINPTLRAGANEESARFLEQTRTTLFVPPVARFQPRRDMLVSRYDYYPSQYDWAPAVR